MSELRYCAEQARRGDRDRFLCSLFAPPAPRAALAVLSAFNLEIAGIRDRVSQPLLGEIRLQWWRDAVAAIYDGRPRAGHAVVAALADIVGRYQLSREHFEALLDARARDFDETAPADTAELVRYAEGTSASLTLLSLQVLDAVDPVAREAGRSVGIAWALIGLLRSVPYHARRQRFCLPADLTERAGLDTAQSIRAGTPKRLFEVIAAVADEARRHLAVARAVRPTPAHRALPALLPATLADGYLRRLHASGYDPFACRLEAAGAAMQLRLLARAWRGRY